jgi:hypothetical protein
MSFAMRTPLLACLLGAAVLRAQGPIIDFPQTVPIGEPNLAFTATLRQVAFLYQPPVMLPPVWILPGTTVRLQLGSWAKPGDTFDWYRSGQRLPITGNVLDLGKITAAESGAYTATLHREPSAPIAGGEPVVSETITLSIGQPPIRTLVNVSTLARITPALPSFTTGLVVAAHSYSHPSTVFVRAVGPSLARYVSDPLAAPRVKIFDARGAEVTPLLVAAPSGGDPITQTAHQVGAFPVPVGTKDFAQLVSLAAGAYILQVTSADGGSGAVLLEVYEVP